MSSQSLTKTGLPMLIDSDLVNTLDFHIAATDLVGIVDEYANYIATSYVRNYQQHTFDPIYHDALFFLRLNDSTLNFDTKVNDKALYEVDGYEQGRENAKVHESFAKGAYLADLDTLLEDNEVWVRGEDNWPVSKGPKQGDKQFEITWSSGKKETVSEATFNGMNLYRSGATAKELPRDPLTATEGREYHALNLRTGDDRWVPYKKDTRKLVKAKLQNLQDEFGMEQMDNEFALYWINKFRRSHDKTREIYRSLIQNEKQFEITWPGKQFEITWSSGKKETVSEATFNGMNLYRSGATVEELPRTKETVSETTFNGMNLYRSGATVEELPRDTTNDFFTDLSDSIGSLSMTDSMADTSIIPYPDIEYNWLETTPSVVTGVLESKLDKETKILVNEMSKKTDNIFKRNMSAMVRQFKMSDEAHGEDLMTDYAHWARTIAIQSALDESVSEIIGKSYKMLGYIRNAINNQWIKCPMVELAVEDASARVTLLKEKIDSIPRPKVNDDTLKAGRVSEDQS